MSIFAMIVVTVGIFASSWWDRIETKRALLERRIREGNPAVRVHGAFSGKLKLIITGIAMGGFWLAYFIESVAHALIYGTVLAGIFCGLALWARRAGRR